MVGQLKARKFPTQTHKGTVFVWMGEGEPVPIETDVPPEFFLDDNTLIVTTWLYWRCNWMIALENTSDAHNATYVHRNALRHLFGPHAKTAARPRTPLGYSSKIVNGRAAVGSGREAREKVAEYYHKDGKMPYQLDYPRVGKKWPLTRYRLLWAWFFTWIERFYSSRQLLEGPEEWRGGMHLPGMQRVNHLYTRWCVPVDENLTRVLYARTRRIKTKVGRFYERLSFRVIIEWLNHYNFSEQDFDAMRSARWQYPEYLSATDAHVVAQRRRITEHARGLKRPVEVEEVTTAEQLVVEAHELLGVTRTDDAGFVTGSGQPKD